MLKDLCLSSGSNECFLGTPPESLTFYPKAPSENKEFSGGLSLEFSIIDYLPESLSSLSLASFIYSSTLNSNVTDSVCYLRSKLYLIKRFRMFGDVQTSNGVLPSESFT